MDPIAHTLAGATMAQTGLKRTTPLATATLVIGANLPDIDAIVTFAGSDLSLLYRRGWTHGVVALVVLPILLTLAVVAYDRLFRRRRAPDKSPVAPRWVFGLSVLGVASHFFLDWLNTYGVRLLMPFDGTWFYGDALFIVDPWMWLVLAATVVFAHSHSKFTKAGWIIAGTLASLLVTFAPMVPTAAVVVWWIGIAVIIGLRLRGVEPATNRKLAVGCLVAVCLYLAFIFAVGDRATSAVDDHLLDDGDEVVEMMTGPVPATPFEREVVAATDDHYHGLTYRLFGEPAVERRYEPVPIEEPTGIVAEALEDESVAGFANWMRFPVYEVIERTDGSRQVVIRDLRYVDPDDDPDTPGIGIATVDVD